MDVVSLRGRAPRISAEGSYCGGLGAKPAKEMFGLTIYAKMHFLFVFRVSKVLKGKEISSV